MTAVAKLLHNLKLTQIFRIAVMKNKLWLIHMAGVVLLNVGLSVWVGQLKRRNRGTSKQTKFAKAAVEAKDNDARRVA